MLFIIKNEWNLWIEFIRVFIFKNLTKEKAANNREEKEIC